MYDNAQRRLKHNQILGGVGGFCWNGFVWKSLNFSVWNEPGHSSTTIKWGCYDRTRIKWELSKIFLTVVSAKRLFWNLGTQIGWSNRSYQGKRFRLKPSTQFQRWFNWQYKKDGVSRSKWPTQQYINHPPLFHAMTTIMLVLKSIWSLFLIQSVWSGSMILQSSFQANWWPSQKTVMKPHCKRQWSWQINGLELNKR